MAGHGDDLLGVVVVVGAGDRGGVDGLGAVDGHRGAGIWGGFPSHCCGSVGDDFVLNGKSDARASRRARGRRTEAWIETWTERRWVGTETTETGRGGGGGGTGGSARALNARNGLVRRGREDSAGRRRDA